MKSRAILFVALGLAVSTGIILGLTYGSEERKANQNKFSPSEAKTLTPVGIVKPLPPVQTADKDGWGKLETAEKARTRKLYESTPDLRAFFEDGLRHPDGGGLFYAKRAFSDCNLIKGTLQNLDDEVKVPPAVLAGLHRCGSLGDADSRQRLMSTLSLYLASSDQSLTVSQRLQNYLSANSMSNDMAQRSLADAISTGDPYVLMGILNVVIPTATDFDGEVIDQKLRSQLFAASTIAYCGLGAECRSSPGVLLSCLSPDKCVANQIDLALAPYSQSNEDRSKVFALSDRILEGAKDGSLPLLFQKM